MAAILRTFGVNTFPPGTGHWTPDQKLRPRLSKWKNHSEEMGLRHRKRKNGDAADDKRALGAVEKREELNGLWMQKQRRPGINYALQKKKKEINKNDETHYKNWQKIVYAIRSTKWQKRTKNIQHKQKILLTKLKMHLPKTEKE